MDRTRTVKVLLILAVAVPVILEGWTVSSMFISAIYDRPENQSVPSNSTINNTIGPGDTFLAETEAEETIKKASIIKHGENWAFYFSLHINNTSNRKYQLSLESITLNSGKTQRIPHKKIVNPGQSSTLNSSWEIPPGSTPKSFTVKSLIGDGRSDTKPIIQSYNLTEIPVRNQ